MVQTMQPRILPRKEHRISRKQISPNVLRTLYRLRDKGFIAYLVGGCVRDLLLERTPKDFDIATNATPNQIKRLFRNCRLVGRRFRLAHLHFQDEILEVSTFRAAAPSDEGDMDEPGPENRPVRHLKDSDGMVLRDNVFGTPEEDALRRDFTINALVYNIADFSVIDYSTGLSDLHGGLIRPIGDPYERFTEDPVRMLRAVRFAATHNFAIEPATWESLCELSSTISRASPARLYEEILKLFLLGAAQSVFSLLEISGLLTALFPMLSQWLSRSSHLRAIVFGNLECLDRLCQSGAPPSPSLFFAAFFGPSLEEAVSERQRDGIPRQQALDAVCAASLQEIRKTVSIPGPVGTQLRNILAMQPSMHRRPPRRPSVMVNRPEFADALAYLRLTAESRRESQDVLKWWEAFLAGTPPSMDSAPPTNTASAKRRRKRRRRHRPATPISM
ncbi:poly(A) polymerase [Syntrophus gentianae]|uniref:Poly(A) polymerase I n=2 Tax=Syntrophus gentianae TaxID=43775 RepID=A0A1H8A6F3_9BACT|nr:poly(A) polymerase [Syntrophus gentianae]